MPVSPSSSDAALRAALAMAESEIRTAVRQGMIDACAQMGRFTACPAELLSAEYLFTAATANAIASLNGPNAAPYLIRVEQSASEFAKHCLLPYVRSSQGRLVRPLQPSGFRAGRIDVAVYSDLYGSPYPLEQPICAIELKGFGPAKAEVMKDLIRNRALLCLAGITGNSVLAFSLFAALYSYKVGGKHRPGAKEVLVSKLYKNYLDELKFGDVVSEISTFTVSIDAVGELIDNWDYIEVNPATKHHFVGVLVCMRKPQGDTAEQLSADARPVTPATDCSSAAPSPSRLRLQQLNLPRTCFADNGAIGSCCCLDIPS
jgi:hypothetical protein